MTEPTFISSSAELADAMSPSAKDAADWAASYRRYQNPACLVLADGEQVSPKDAKKELDALNHALKSYLLANNLESGFEVEGLGTLALQLPSTEKVDLISLHQHNPRAFFRLLELGCLTVDGASMKAQQKLGNIAEDIPTMPVGGTPRLVWIRND